MGAQQSTEAEEPGEKGAPEADASPGNAVSDSLQAMCLVVKSSVLILSRYSYSLQNRELCLLMNNIADALAGSNKHGDQTLQIQSKEERQRELGAVCCNCDSIFSMTSMKTPPLGTRNGFLRPASLRWKSAISLASRRAAEEPPLLGRLASGPSSSPRSRPSWLLSISTTASSLRTPTNCLWMTATGRRCAFKRVGIHHMI